MNFIKKLFGGDERPTPPFGGDESKIPLLAAEKIKVEKAKKAIEHLSLFQNAAPFCSAEEREMVYSDLKALRKNHCIKAESQLPELIDKFYQAFETLGDGEKTEISLLSAGFGDSKFPADIQKIADKISAEIKQIKI